ncbi:hypothetical protein ACFQ7B_35585 [Streptomyces erythrochromogenes]|uniref:hypothetical protein n=1 Tax=Streptomyces erythrochromogenes TaxID=285574 RepID=UPI00368313FF
MELSENEVPGTRELVEDYTPYIGETSILAPPPSHTDKTRRVIALGLLGLLGFLAVAAFAALIFGSWPKFTAEQFRELNLFFTPIVALASAAFGFYFGSDPKTSADRSSTR